MNSYHQSSYRCGGEKLEPIFRETFRQVPGRRLADLKSHQARQNHGLGGIDDGAVEIGDAHQHLFEVRLTEVGAAQAGLPEVGPGEPAAAEEDAGEVGFAEVGFGKVGGGERTAAEEGAGELGEAQVGVLDEDIAAVGGAGGEAGKAAVDEFDADQVEAVGAYVGEVATDEADVFPDEGPELATGQPHTVEHATLEMQDSGPPVHPGGVLQLPALETDRATIRGEVGSRRGFQLRRQGRLLAFPVWALALFHPQSIVSRKPARVFGASLRVGGQIEREAGALPGLVIYRRPW